MHIRTHTHTHTHTHTNTHKHTQIFLYTRRPDRIDGDLIELWQQQRQRLRHIVLGDVLHKLCDGAERPGGACGARSTIQHFKEEASEEGSGG